MRDCLNLFAPLSTLFTFQPLCVRFPAITFFKLYSQIPVLDRSHLESTGLSAATFCQFYMLRFRMGMLKKLWEVGSVENFKEVFIDCLECEYASTYVFFAIVK